MITFENEKSLKQMPKNNQELILSITYSFKPVMRRKLPMAYDDYFSKIVFQRENWAKILFEFQQEPLKINIINKFVFHLTRIVYSRFQAINTTGTLSSLFLNYLDPIVLEITANQKLLGYCFIERQTLSVFQISLITNLDQNLTEEIKSYILVALKKYLSTLGAKRIFIRTSNDETKELLKSNNFTLAFQDSVLFLDL